jgi:hypothetical protein
VDSVELGERLDREIWNKSSFKHRPMGNALQDPSVRCCLSSVSVIMSPFWNTLL